jgi:16S rRNA (guanine(966)-N(2))-methyltransferase RsmD
LVEVRPLKVLPLRRAADPLCLARAIPYYSFKVRIIAGDYRGRVLKSPPSLQVRPTSDRLRETLFNILMPRIAGSAFLDLCSGSGAVGIEALSRGAEHVTFVDKSRKMCGLIEANLDLVGVPEPQTDVVMAEAAEFLKKAASKSDKAWDLIFFDPPYANDYLPALRILGSSTLLNQDGLFIVEHHQKKELPDEIGQLRRWRVVKQGDSCLSFFEFA